jgi:hypothetical protein
MLSGQQHGYCREATNLLGFLSLYIEYRNDLRAFSRTLHVNSRKFALTQPPPPKKSNQTKKNKKKTIYRTYFVGRVFLRDGGGDGLLKSLATFYTSEKNSNLQISNSKGWG